MDPALKIELLAPAAADDPGLTSRLTDLVNEVYRVAEDGLWADQARRTSVNEVTGLVRAGEIAVARRAGEIVGCVRIQSLDADTGELGLLAADPALRGTGIGRELVHFAEAQARGRGHGAMRLELLVPRDWVHPSKDFLAGWYGRIGYVVIGKGTIDEAYPALAPLLVTPCDFLIYEKDLRLADHPARRRGPDR
jgi:GNAT superfamily N-acetyltransferase